jgi:hypothetical protein
METGKRFLILCITIFTPACGNSGKTTHDTVSADLADTILPDPGTPDLTTDPSPPPDAPETCQPPGPVPQDPIDPDLKKFSLALFHWNLQYVPGGLVAQWDGKPLTLCGVMGLDDSYCDGWDNDRLEDWILTESFKPVLDLYDAHPDWRATFEVPGYMLEVMGRRHPALLDRLRTAARAGRIEIASFHYAVQLFLAFPALDLQRSQERTRKVFEDLCVPLSAVVFNQEGQSGEGKHAYMASHGFAIDVMHANQYTYVRKGEPLWPYYEDRGVKVIVGPPGIDESAGLDPASPVDVKWAFFDDGEVLATPMNPYFAPVSAADPDAVKTYEAKVQALVDQGYRPATIAGFVAQLQAQAVPARPLKSIVDDSWQPADTDSVHLWLGGRSRAPYATYERDNDLRTESYGLSRDLAALEVLADAAAKAGKDVVAAREQILQAWRHLAMAEVSDATGITPWPGELAFGMAENAAARVIVEAQFHDLLAVLAWPHTEVDLVAGTADRIDVLPPPDVKPGAAPPFDVKVDAPTRTVDVKWWGKSKKHYVLEITFGPGGDPTGEDASKCTVTATFPRYEDVLAYTPALLEDEVVEHAFSEYAFQKPEVYLPLSNGLIGLGQGFWVIRDNRTVMIAPRVGVGPEDKVVQFRDETADPAGTRTWVFHVLGGSTKEEALELAAKVNLKPAIVR